MCHSSALAADVTPGEAVTAAFTFLNLYVKMSKKINVWNFWWPCFQAGCRGSLSPRLAARVPATSAASCTGAGALVSQRRLVPGAAARSVRAALAGPGSQLACLPVFFSIPQSVVWTGKALDVAVGHTAGPCVHAGPDPPVAQHLVTCRRFVSDVPAWSTRSGQSSLGEVCFPPAHEREQGA